MGHDLSLRPWNKSDCSMIYEWRMDPSVRKVSLNKAEFPYEEHQKWFNSFLDNKLSFGFILEDYGKPVAQIRFDKTRIEGYYNVSIFTAPKLTKRGYGTAVLRLSCLDKSLLAHAKFLVAEVFEDNIPSRKIFERSGFIQTGETKVQGHRVLLYKLQI